MRITHYLARILQNNEMKIEKNEVLQVLKYELGDCLVAAQPPLLLTAYWKVTVPAGGGGTEGGEPFSASNVSIFSTF